MILRYLCLFLTATSSLLCSAQEDPFDAFLKGKIKFEVKQLGQFFERFNMTDTVPLISGKTPSKYTNVLSLCDMRNKHLTNDSAVLNFAAEMQRTGQKLGYHDSNWFATANAVFSINGSKKEIPVTLKYIKNKGLGYSWIIIGANLDALGTELKKSNTKSITPMNNEINFIDLSKALERKKEIASYTDDEFNPDYLSVFLYLVESGNMSFLHINKVVYHFLNLPGWIFTVENFNRMDYNSGWLIAGLARSTDDAKKNYKKNILKIH